MRPKIKQSSKYPKVPLPDDEVLTAGVGVGVTTGGATIVSVIELLVDKPFESVALKDNSTVPAVAGATKFADSVSALFNVTAVPDVCCHR